MDLQDNNEQSISYPFITFKIDNANYCISSKMVSSMTMMSELITIPEGPEYVLGLMKHKKEIVPMIDMRTLLGIDSLEKVINNFANTLNQRKKDHLNWVEALESSAINNTEFKLATDPHDCAFGKWYYSYKTDNNVILSVLQKMEEPHERLHTCAIRIRDCQEGDGQCKKTIFSEAREICHEEILPIIDEIEETFRGEIKGMAIILEHDDKLHGIMVDSVDAIEYFDYENQNETIRDNKDDSYIKSVIKNGDAKLYLEIDADKIIGLYKNEAMV